MRVRIHTKTQYKCIHGHFGLSHANDYVRHSVTDVSGCLAVLLCCLQAGTHAKEEVVHAVLTTMIEWRNSKEDWFLFSR